MPEDMAKRIVGVAYGVREIEYHRQHSDSIEELVRKQRAVLARALAVADAYLDNVPGWDANGAPL